jgi:ribosomal protein L14E/L6E/L27E
MSIWETFQNMQKEAAAEEVEKSASTESQEEVDDQVEELQKYAEWAEGQLAEEKGAGNYTEDEVMKLAEAKIEAEIEEAIEREKVAELYEAGQVMYAGFKAALEEDSAN